MRKSTKVARLKNQIKETNIKIDKIYKEIAPLEARVDKLEDRSEQLYRLRDDLEKELYDLENPE